MSISGKSQQVQEFVVRAKSDMHAVRKSICGSSSTAAFDAAALQRFAEELQRSSTGAPLSNNDTVKILNCVRGIALHARDIAPDDGEFKYLMALVIRDLVPETTPPAFKGMRAHNVQNVVASI